MDPDESYITGYALGLTFYFPLDSFSFACVNYLSPLGVSLPGSCTLLLVSNTYARLNGGITTLGPWDYACDSSQVLQNGASCNMTQVVLPQGVAASRYSFVVTSAGSAASLVLDSVVSEGPNPDYPACLPPGVQPSFRRLV